MFHLYRDSKTYEYGTMMKGIPRKEKIGNKRQRERGKKNSPFKETNMRKGVNFALLKKQT